MERQHSLPHSADKRILIWITVLEICGHCQNLLDDQRDIEYHLEIINGNVGQAFSPSLGGGGGFSVSDIG